MKKIVFLVGAFLMVMSTSSMACGEGPCVVQNFYQQPEVKRKLKSKVIIKKVIVERPVVVEKIVEKKVYVVKEVKVERIVKKTIHKLNRVSLLAGAGPTKLSQTAPQEISMVRGPVGGIQYQRSLSEESNWNLGIQYQKGFDRNNNDSVLGSVGYDF